MCIRDSAYSVFRDGVYRPALYYTKVTLADGSTYLDPAQDSYACLLYTSARCAAVYGLLPWAGLHHCSQLNQYNLADDLMEPFRPVVDLYVAANVDRKSVV